MYIERNITNKFNKIKEVYNCIALVGARQSGKTTFLREQIKHSNSSYVLFDDPDARSLFEEDVKKFEIQYIDNYEITILDEIQYCTDAGRKLKYLIDEDKKIWITSSSQIILSKEVLSYLVGRVSIIILYPFSLSEFLMVKGQKELTKVIVERNIWEHIVYGGYPKVVITEDIETKKIILKDLYDTMILKDMSRTFSIEDINSLENFVKYMAVNLGSIVSYENISNDIKISFRTVKKYLDAMEKSYLIIRVIPFYKNKGKELIKQPKFYFLDTGLRNAITKNFSMEHDGKLFENYVLSELIKEGLSVKYWRTKSKAEVDFIVEKESEIIPIEVKLNAEPTRIERSLNSFIETYKPRIAIVVTYNGDKGEMKIGGCRVIFTDLIGIKNILNEADKNANK